MKKISLSVLAALMAVTVAVPASAAKITVGGSYENSWSYVNSNIEPNNLFDNQKLSLNLTIEEGDMFKAYMPLSFTTPVVGSSRGIGFTLGNGWYVSFVSEEASVWASANGAKGYKFEAVGDPLGIGKNITIGSALGLVNSGLVTPGNLTATPKLSASLNTLLKGQFNFGKAKLVTYVADNTLKDSCTATNLDSIDFITSVSRLTVDLPYDIDLGLTASYVGINKFMGSNDPFFQLALSADASYDLGIENIGGKVTAAVAGMLQREDLNTADDSTKVNFVDNSLGLYVGATDFVLGPVTVGADFSMAMPGAYGLTTTYPSAPSDPWKDVTLQKNSLAGYYMDSASRYLPNLSMLNVNASSNFNIGNVDIDVKLANKLNMATVDAFGYGDDFSKVTSNVTVLNTDFAVTEGVNVSLDTTLDYRFATPIYGKALENAIPAVDSKLGIGLDNLGLGLNARVRYTGIEDNPIQAAVDAKFSKDVTAFDDIVIKPVVAAGLLIDDKDEKMPSITSGRGFVTASTTIDKYSVDASYLLKVDECEEGYKINHVANANLSVTLNDMFSAKAGYTFRTENKDSMNYVSASLTANVSDSTKLVLSYGTSGVKSDSGFDSGKAWSGIVNAPGAMNWNNVGLKLTISF